MFEFPFLLFQKPDPKVEETKSIIDVLLAGGPLGIAIIVILLVLSVIATYIFITRYMSISRASSVDENFMNTIRMNVQQGNIQAARALCQRTDTPVARVVEKGLLRIGKPLEDIGTAIRNVGELEVFKLERHLSTLASVAGAAPMIGFFGTVTGMILTFQTMSTNAAAEELAGGIYQALMTTAFGLFVGILAFIGYNLLVAKVNQVIFKIEASAMEFIDLLQEPAA